MIARKEETLLIKALVNVDALQEEHALSMNTISYFCSAYPFIISLKNSREFLADDTTYYRFGIPVMTPKLFEKVLEGEIPVKESSKGRYTMEIDVKLLRKRRKKLNYTLEELSKRVGISKKALYEIENARVRPQYETVEKLEMILGIELKKPFEKRIGRKVYLKPKTEFQAKVSEKLKDVGIDNSPIYSSPFEIVGKAEEPVLTCLCEEAENLRKKCVIVKRVSSLLSCFSVVISGRMGYKKKTPLPVLHLSELDSIGSPEEFFELVREKKVN